MQVLHSVLSSPTPNQVAPRRRAALGPAAAPRGLGAGGEAGSPVASWYVYHPLCCCCLFLQCRG